MRNILLCDDDCEIANVCKLIFKKREWVLFHLLNANNIVEHIAYIKPMVVLLDSVLPDVELKQTIQGIKSDQRTRKTPVVLFSAWNHLQQLAEKCDADGYCQKPFKINELITLIEKFSEPLVSALSRGDSGLGRMVS